MITAKVLQHSINQGGEILTFELEYPRFIHSELMTHRVFSRNAASSRAIPIQKMMDQVATNPAMPTYWGLDMGGMQAKEEHAEIGKCKEAWFVAANQAIHHAEKLKALGLHKQIVNRVLEPFQTMKTIVTATEWENFYSLRSHRDAQPEFKVLADTMAIAASHSVPFVIYGGEWHVPYVSRYRCPEYGDLTYYIDNEDQTDLSEEEALKVSSSCCAQVSYRVLDESLDKALKVYKRLVEAKPIHASPFEHQATPAKYKEHCANFKGWAQYRSYLENPCSPINIGVSVQVVGS